VWLSGDIVNQISLILENVRRNRQGSSFGIGEITTTANIQSPQGTFKTMVSALVQGAVSRGEMSAEEKRRWDKMIKDYNSKR